MRTRNIFTLCMITVILLATGCGTRETLSSNKVEEESREVVKETKEPMQETKDLIQETKNPIQVKENTLIFSCKTNKENTPGYQEVESVCSDTFYVSDDKILLDDTLNKRILVYENGEYVKSIELDWNCDVKQMFYSKEDDVIKIVYENLAYTEGPVYYTLDIKMEDGSKANEEKIGDSEHVLLQSYFREDGKLMTTYLDDADNEGHEKIYKEVDKLLSKDFEAEICFANEEENELVLICSKLYSIDEGLGEKEIVLRSENGKFVTFAVPQKHREGLDQGHIKYIDGNIFELAVTEDKIEIYILAEEDTTKSDIRYLERVIR